MLSMSDIPATAPGKLGPLGSLRIAWTTQTLTQKARIVLTRCEGKELVCKLDDLGSVLGPAYFQREKADFHKQSFNLCMSLHSKIIYSRICRLSHAGSHYTFSLNGYGHTSALFSQVSAASACQQETGTLFCFSLVTADGFQSSIHGGVFI